MHLWGGRRRSATQSVSALAPKLKIVTGAGATNAAPPFKVGTMFFPITIQWRTIGSANIHDFPVVRQEHEIFADGKCETRKGGLTESSKHTDPTSTP